MLASFIMKLVFVFGFVLLVVAISRAYYKCDGPVVSYRYIPRTFVEEQENPVPLDDIFYEMFNNPTPWVASVDVERKKNDIGENLNRYYVNQI